MLKGDQEKLNRELQKAEAELKRISNQEERLVSEHSQLFRKPSLFRDLLAPVLKKSFEKLDELRDQGKLPRTTIPVLAERLMGVTCICGESLDQHAEDGKRRREHIEKLIRESQRPDALQRCLTDLHYGSLELKPIDITDAQHWITEYQRISMSRDELKPKARELERNCARWKSNWRV